MISQRLHLMTYADDVVFKKMMEEKGLINALVDNYNNWSGRTGIEFLLISTINIEAFWKIGIPLSMVMISFSIWRITLKNEVSWVIGASFILFLFLNIQPWILNEAAFWITGFYNYLLPSSLAFYSVTVLLMKRPGLFHKTLSIATLTVSCFSEQVALILICAAILIFISKGRCDKFTLLFIIFAVSLFLILILSPGNSVRSAIEAANRMPDFPEYNIIMKLTLGIDRLSQHISDRGNNLFTLLMILCLISSLLQSKSKGVLFWVAAILISIKFSTLLAGDKSVLNKYFYNPHFLDAELWFVSYPYASFFLNNLSLFSIIYLTCKSDIDYDKKVIFSFSLLSGAASVMALSFSPTVYASSMRVLFIYDLMQVIAISSLLSGLIKRYNKGA
ncbi:DUF6056 family protein [Escherichia coli]|uniref:DUF6056 family protein n=3 Tax=Escherichia coli TaxID=562 RepID=UPI00287A26B7|nr:DUF6056 family protein [Escherichia coli]MDS1520671.1 DUF6056 family protein [Escherichia coli]MEB7170070.1 DUF6056 family protein [Escherichia coli]